ncbi:MAG: Na(+)/H(+) antiporter subunit F1 [Syntrophaceticus sp.]|jgi:multicomponent Na+:H+ antiporter subunit F|nr:Na(+)/H(+) antiporter subunit F1 [Syntrophaceticus sp.]MDD3314385.1 Na(+)/H(+) antiporter subunit F1 [Syntrophaceticus sp.]MDD4782752.1 Na(+)/H(+) antiporter subunit F1 [Syntrophaceticus sp.]
MEAILKLSLLLIVLSILATVFRLVRGPSVPDRVQALDMLGFLIISTTAIFTIFIRSTAFFEVILLIGILSFISTVAFARFIERGYAIDRKSD